MNQNKYELSKRRRAYVIYQLEYDDCGGSIGIPVYESYNYEEARKKLYELNGWKYQPKKRQ